MRDVPTRQLPLIIAAIFCVSLRAVSAPANEQDSAKAELAKLKVDTAALIARNAPAQDWEKLGAEYAALAQRFPKNAAVLDAHGEFLWGMNAHDRAMQQWLAGEKVETNNASILVHLAGAYMSLGNSKSSLDYYLRAAEAEPGNAQVHFSAANIACLFRHDVGRTEAECFTLALKHFAEAHRLAPKNADYARGYAETFYLVPDPDWQTALKVWKSYINLVPEKNFGLINLTRVHMKIGDAKSARACLDQVTGEANERIKTRLLARIEAELPSVESSKAAETENSSKPVIDGKADAP